MECLLHRGLEMGLDDLIKYSESQIEFWKNHLKILQELKEMQDKMPGLQAVQKDHLELLLRLQTDDRKTEALPEIPEQNNRGRWVYGPDRSLKAK